MLGAATYGEGILLVSTDDSYDKATDVSLTSFRTELA